MGLLFLLPLDLFSWVLGCPSFLLVQTYLGSKNAVCDIIMSWYKSLSLNISHIWHVSYIYLLFVLLFSLPGDFPGPFLSPGKQTDVADHVLLARYAHIKGPKFH